jgi:hypothetical protein
MREITEAHQARIRELQLALAQQVERLEELRPRRSV